MKIDVDERDPESIDWGDDGPTLVQKSKEARALIERARRNAPPRVRDDDSISDDDSSEGPTRVGRVRDVEAEIARHRPDDDVDADATVQLTEAGAQARALLKKGELGEVAPDDPDVPPLPLADRLQQMKTQRASQPPPKRGLPPRRPSGGGTTDDTAATRPISAAEAEAFDEIVERPSRPAQYARKLSPGIDVELDAPMIGALPAPRFPSAVSLSGEVLSTDFSAEAVRLANLAQRQTEMAVAARHAATLAEEASTLASDGQQHAALVQLREAQGIAEELHQGKVPEGDWAEDPDGRVSVLARPSAMLPESAVVAVVRLLRTREGKMVAGLAVVGLLLVMLLILAIFW